jgi:hypothetical protein
MLLNEFFESGGNILGGVYERYRALKFEVPNAFTGGCDDKGGLFLCKSVKFANKRTDVVAEVMDKNGEFLGRFGFEVATIAERGQIPSCLVTVVAVFGLHEGSAMVTVGGVFKVEFVGGSHVHGDVGALFFFGVFHSVFEGIDEFGGGVFPEMFVIFYNRHVG